MRVLVTGGAGYIGSHAVVELLDRGYEVTVIDNLSTGHLWAVDKRAQFVQGDVRSFEFLSALLQSIHIDAVMHFAASIVVAESEADPLKYFDNNTCATVTLLRAMISNNVKKIIFSSTAAVYGDTDIVPVTEDLPAAPISPYGQTKRQIETIFEDCARAYGLKYCVFRYFNVSGAHEKYFIGQAMANNTALIPIILEAAAGERPSVKVFGDDYDTPDGTGVRDFIHVVDLVDAHILGLKYLENHDLGIFNLGNGRGFTVMEMIQAARRVTGEPIPAEVVPRRPGDIAVSIADSSRAVNELGWKPRYTNVADIIRTAWNFKKKYNNGKFNN